MKPHIEQPENQPGYFPCSVLGIFYLPYLLDETFQKYHREVQGSPINVLSFWNLYILAKQSLCIEGSFFECGVFSGGSALFLAQIMEGSGKKLHLFDTWKGMPQVSACDLHETGDFDEVSLYEVKDYIGHWGQTIYHQGVIPDTFSEVEEDRIGIAFAHVDVDIYQSVKDCCEFIYPRLSTGGVIVFDDYGQYTCPGARDAVDEYFADKRSVPLLIGSQAMVVKI